MGRFPWKDFLKKLAAVSIPVALQNLLTTTGSMIDTMMIGSLGELSVGAVGLCAQFSSLLFSCYWGFVGGGMLFFGQYWGAKDDDGIDRSYGVTLSFMMLVAVLFSAAAIFAPQTVMRIYTDKASIQVIGVEYLTMVGASYLFQVFSVAMSALLRSTEQVKIPLYGALASVVTNIALNYVLIYGHFGCPAMGVRGAALATLAASVVNCAAILILAKKKGYPYLFHYRRHFGWTKAHLKLFFSRCLPILCSELSFGFSGMVMNMVLGRQSETAIAALAVFRTLEGLVIGFFAGFSNAGSVLVGKCVGSGELETAYQRAKRLVLMCGSSIFVLCMALVAVRMPLLRLMGLRGESASIASGMLQIYAVAAVLRMCNWVQNDTYRSAGDVSYGTILEMVTMYTMVIPCVCLTGLWWKLPFLWVFVSCYIDEPLRFCLMLHHTDTGRWVKPVTEQGKAALPAFVRRRAESREARKHRRAANVH